MYLFRIDHFTYKHLNSNYTPVLVSNEILPFQYKIIILYNKKVAPYPLQMRQELYDRS